MVQFRPIKLLNHYLQSLVESKLWVKVLTGMFLGIGFGVLLGPDVGLISQDKVELITSWTALPGNVFLRLVQMIMIPLVVSSIIQGIAGGDNAEQLKTVGARIGIYFLVTTAVAIAIGVLIALVVKPGNFASMVTDDVGAQTSAMVADQLASERSLPSRITNLLPSNPLQAILGGEMLSIVIFSIVIGIALTNIRQEAANPLVGVLFATQEVCMTVIKWAMKIAPFAVFGLISQIIARVGFGALLSLGVYVLTVIVGLLILLALYLIILKFFAGMAPRMFLRETKDLLLLAFSVASSAAVMPMSMKTLEERLDVEPSISRFIIPIGATVNMNGTALYQAVATIFIAQVYGIELTTAHILLIVTTTVAASIGTPSSPGAGIVILGTVLSGVGIPLEGIAMIIGVDSFLGMCRAAVNVAGDMTASVLFDRVAKRNGAKSVTLP
ncbi:MAG: dicarboxylate/amino acid:cation symporter [Cryomorphaceae bacterium]|nr:dicarboxylate/amino acid:cation symporter [Cryomorphaceae bacterium]